MAKRRKAIPTSTVDRITFLADRTCCICRTKGKAIQIHHIDGDPSNNKDSNLAALCLDCHDQATATGGLGRRLTPGQVRQFKRAWEKQVRDSRRVHRPAKRYTGELISHVDIIICEMLASKNAAHIKQHLDTLWELYIWRGTRELDERILDGLEHSAVMVGLDPAPLATFLPEVLWNMCCHFVGPDDVRMDVRGRERVLRCMAALETLTTMNCEFGHGRKATHAIAEWAEAFFEIGLWYSKKDIANAVIRVYEQGLKACSEDDNDFAYGRATLLEAIPRLLKLLSDQHPGWSRQHQRLKRLLPASKRRQAK